MGVTDFDKYGEVRSMSTQEPNFSPIYQILKKQNRILYEVTSEISVRKIKGKWAELVEQMSVGDSVLVASRAEAQGLQHAILRRYYWCERNKRWKTGKLSRSRKEGQGFRVWRLQ